MKTKLRLKNGVVVEVEKDNLGQAIALYAAAGLSPELVLPERVYYSRSRKESVEIATMADEYLRNAFLAGYRRWLDSLAGISLSDLKAALIAGPKDKEFTWLSEELAKRTRNA